MKLLFQEEHRSITAPLTTEDLPDFLVLCGLNGSGKSQLLQAIEIGAVQIPPTRASMEFGRYGPDLRSIRLTGLNTVATGDGRIIAGQTNNLQVIADSIEDFRRSRSSPTEEELERQLVARNLISKDSAERTRERAGKNLLDMSLGDLMTSFPVLESVSDPLVLNLTDLFTAYETRRRYHLYQRFLEDQGEIEGRHSLVGDEFTNAYGDPPWVLMSGVLKGLGLPYEFSAPPAIRDNSPYVASLVDSQRGISVDTTSLSSGEKVLLTIAASVYAVESGESLSLPEVILLDEVDGALHPSMVRNLITIIEDVLVAKFSAKVLLTTHSPTTVALAPEESLYAMRRNGEPRIVKTSRAGALATLLVGVPTISVNASGQRLVFTEGPSDAECYTEMFKWVKPLVKTELSLVFQPSGVGGTAKKGDSGNRDLVIQLVETLQRNGIRSVRGVVDRDGDEVVEVPEGVHTLARRDSIENLAYDPTVLGAFLYMDKKIAPAELGWDREPSIHELTERDFWDLSKCVSSRLRDGEDPSREIQVKYQGGFNFSIPAWYLELDGHQLESRLRRSFAGINRLEQHRLMVEIVGRSYGTFPMLIPLEMVDLFTTLLNTPSESVRR